MKEKVNKIEKFDFLPFRGPINLQDPQVSFYYFEYYENDQNSSNQTPCQIIFGRWIADSNRKFISKFTLKTRKFIANTSMDPILSFLMSNIAQIGPNDLVYDPFVGSGSLLVSAAFHGAYICGADIDYLLLHGLAKPSRCGEKVRQKDESVLANFKQYNLESRYLDVIAADFSLPILKRGLLFDAIITDPPYGKREARERIGTLKNIKIPEELIAAHIPSKLEYTIDDLYKDLMNFAASHLKLFGRILFWAPYTNASGDEMNEERKKINSKKCQQIDFIPQTDLIKIDIDLKKRFSHPNLKFISYSRQELTSKYYRILIVMERIV